MRCRLNSTTRCSRLPPGRVEPRSAPPNEETAFTYTLLPSAGSDDIGFDLMRFDLPGPINLPSVSVEKGAATVSSTASLRGDSLLIALPDPVRDDSVRVHFTTRLVRNATLFALDLGLQCASGPVAVGRTGSAPRQYRHAARTDQ